MTGIPEKVTRPPPSDTPYLTGIMVKAMTYADQDPETANMATAIFDSKDFETSRQISLDEPQNLSGAGTNRSNYQ